MRQTSVAAALVLCCVAVESVTAADARQLAGTRPLTMDGDIAARLVAGVDRFLLRKLAAAPAARAHYWQPAGTSPEQVAAADIAHRERLAHIVGLRDPRPPFDRPQLLAGVGQSARVGEAPAYDVFAVRWPACGEISGEGLLLVPRGRSPLADVVALPDADLSPEQIAGLVAGVPVQQQYARRLAESGCRVLVPTLISRRYGQFPWTDGRRYGVTNREFLYRSAFELGRHLIGYELQKILAGVDWFSRAGGDEARIGVVGWGEGGLLALYAAAVDPRIDAALVSGYFDAREELWREPIDRNAFGLLERFGEAELAALVAPRRLIVEAARGPEKTIEGGGGAPGLLATPEIGRVRREVARARALVGGRAGGAVQGDWFELVESDGGAGPAGSEAALTAFLAGLETGAPLAPSGPAPRHLREAFDPDARMLAQMREIDRQSQRLLRDSPRVRRAFMQRLDTSTPASYAESSAWYRDFFYDEVIGRFADERLPPDPRTRQAYDTEKYTGYEVALDVFPDVFAYGILLLPKGIAAGERRPAVVCQHGLEGRPQQLVAGDHRAYHDFAARLAERGFVVFAPQNLYIGGDRFRTLQRKANPLKKTLFSVMVPQHQQIVDWLQTRPEVDPQRIGFYGLSYGGKSAMRIPPLVTDYALSICSADFNEWVDKNASTRNPRSYVWTGEYEIFEFDLGSTFNYAEMAALIAPRPFMVERGHFDGVADDETVASEFAKVRHLYAARLKLPDRCAIEWFDGPHTIHGVGTFEFLHRHLNWPR